MSLHADSDRNAVTLSIADKDRVVEYIKTQKEHHRCVSTREEMRDMLKEFGIEYDEQYI